MSNHFHNYIHTHRRRHALSQDELAVLVGTESGSIVSRYEHGNRNPSLETALALEIVFKAPIGELFAGLSKRVEADVSERARALLEAIPESMNAEFAKKVELLSKLARPDDEVIVPLWEEEP